MEVEQRAPQRGVEPAQASLALPPLELPPAGPGQRDALTDFVRTRTRRWGGVPVELTPAVVGALWTILVLNLAFGGWLLAVRAGSAPCSGVLCWAATLGDHPVLTLVLSLVSAGALAVSVPTTRGLTRAAGPQLALIVVGALSGVIALAGLVASLAVAALCLVLAFGIFALVVERL